MDERIISCLETAKIGKQAHTATRVVTKLITMHGSHPMFDIK
jgi:hypothetical protein